MQTPYIYGGTSKEERLLFCLWIREFDKNVLVYEIFFSSDVYDPVLTLNFKLSGHWSRRECGFQSNWKVSLKISFHNRKKLAWIFTIEVRRMFIWKWESQTSWKSVWRVEDIQTWYEQKKWSDCLFEHDTSKLTLISI